MPAAEARTVLQTDPVAQQLLQSTIPARLAYTWRDGSPRVVPMWFHWTGEDLLMGAPPNAPKMKVLAERPAVALSVDSNEWPYQVLAVRGTAQRGVGGRPLPGVRGHGPALPGRGGGGAVSGAVPADVLALDAHRHPPGGGPDPRLPGPFPERLEQWGERSRAAPAG